MKIAKDTVVVLTYELTVEGKVFDKTTAEKPLDYIHGEHMLLAALEDKLTGMEAGQKFEATLSAEEGYGPYDESRKVSLPKNAFEINGVLHEELLVVGRVIPMLNAASQVVEGTVAEVLADEVIMDFNHPLAGKELHFTGEIVSVREATQKEITEGLHGEFLPKQGGCGGGCKGGCGGGCGSGCGEGGGCGDGGCCSGGSCN